MKPNEFELNKTYLGNCIELSKELPNNFIDLIITSPPYANAKSYGESVRILSPDKYTNWLLPLFIESARFLTPTASFILNINDKIDNGERSIYVFELVCKIVKETNLKLFDRYIWHKKTTIPSLNEKRLNDRIEYIFHFVKDVKNFKANADKIRVPYQPSSLRRFKGKINRADTILPNGKTIISQHKSVIPHPLGTKPTTVFQFDTCSALRELNHPAPFHPQLPEFFIKWLTNENDIVLDPFMGSGTVAEVCLKMNRKYLGFEINPTYIEMTNDRIVNKKFNHNKFFS